ncbi:hypothetical protein JRO89_XS02G0077800 [Xanthoceras sorbifolium]|uniref:Uncharacterized protein n=1 Tax=Xanthoceras sorbifolium TaxID=99658 RepID=A0ABQ8IF30_9ROSI|nr:hypothetical protein JRO89_XS02G0077800 [Xanthoceras sorbifolium]
MADEILIPTIEMARLFARHGVKATIISTPLNTPFISEKIEKDRQFGADIDIRVIKFPSVEAGLPEGCENLEFITSPEMAINFKVAHILLQQPFEQLLQEFPDMICHEPHKRVTSDLEPFTIPGLPGHVKLTRLQRSNFIREADKNEIAKLLDQSHKAELTSYGVIINSFHELEPAYTEHYRKVMGRQAWHIAAQLLEIAMGLEASKHHFIWVQINNEDKEEWMPEGFEERMQGKGFIKRGWTPLIQILEHEAAEGFLTHCECNSILESIAAGVPMEWSRWIDDKKFIMKKDDIANAVTRLMFGEEAEKMRSKATVHREMARRVVEDGGSSYSDLNALLKNLRSHRS